MPVPVAVVLLPDCWRHRSPSPPSLPWAEAHWFTYNERMPVESNVHAISDLALDFSDSDRDKKKATLGSRPKKQGKTKESDGF